MKVYRQGTAECRPLARPDAVFRKMSEADLCDRSLAPDDVVQRQQDRLKRFGRSYCYGAYIDGRLAAFAWLLPPDAMKRDVPRILDGGPGEAELTAAETLPEYRGRDLYGFILSNLFSVGRETGVDAVLFKTYPGNKAALRSFAKIGAGYIGTTYFVHIPGLAAPLVWPRRFR